MGRRSGSLLLTAVLSGALLAPTGAALAAPTAVPPGTYQNPLDLNLPDGSEAVSCADPDVIRGAEPDTYWYLYCTTDPLSGSERDADGDLVFHTIPMFRSLDLVEWEYVGDAFPEKPEWIPPTGGIWAPEIVFDGEQYLLYYGAPETLVGGGSSAIGVATSDSPTGPWVDSGGPVVAPHPSGRWQFDPEVLEVDGTPYLYFGSYFGGVFVRELTADGLQSLPETETQIAIDNRYEGTVIVEHDGWYYFMGSATNCCNGPLTGYAVFTARSESPFGPFLDRNGVSILDSQVGGTPLAVQNGNRWVGIGHHDVFTDFGGQDWAIYHAVDQNDPYFEGEVGFTKRPILLDPIDWVDGWPVLRGGFGPSDEPMPAPAAQPGQASAYEPTLIADPKPGRALPKFSDQFGGRNLSPDWTLTRPSETPLTLVDGHLIWPTQSGDLQPPNEPIAAALTRDAPEGDYVVETKVTMSTPAERCCQNYVQGGLVIYGDDGNSVKLVSVSIWNTRQTEFGKKQSPMPEGYPTYGNTVGGPAGDTSYLRITHREVGGEHLYTAFTSLDGEVWDRAGTWTHDLAEPRIGLVSMGGAGFEASFDYVRVRELR